MVFFERVTGFIDLVNRDEFKATSASHGAFLMSKNMKDQHQKIKGYRDLSQEEIDLMNEIKAIGPQVQAVIEKVQQHISTQRYNCKCDAGQALINGEEWDRLEAATPERFAAMAKTDFQTGLMYLVRAVAQPTSF